MPPGGGPTFGALLLVANIYSTTIPVQYRPGTDSSLVILTAHYINTAVFCSVEWEFRFFTGCILHVICCQDDKDD